MNNETEKKEAEKRQTPIIDGDARPDMPGTPEEEEKRKKNAKFESERKGDRNSLEDYKDAK